MSFEDAYMSLHNDLSGSISKNRFRVELLWGVSKMFDIFETNEDFTVIFDNVCDIELHLPNGKEFYQIKSNKKAGTKTVNYYLDTKNTSNSIFGKLIILNNEKYDTKKVALVSNAYLKNSNRVYSEYEEININNIDAKCKNLIIKSLNEELGFEVKIDNFYYIHTSMNLESPDNDLLGKIVLSFEHIMECEPQKPNSLYRFIVEKAQKKACYEFDNKTYDELVRNKGFTKNELYRILGNYKDNIDLSFEKTNQRIEQISSVKFRRELKKALPKLLEDLDQYKIFNIQEEKISKYLEQENEIPDEYFSLVEFLFEIFSPDFPIEISNEEIRVFIMMIVNRWEDNYYE